MMSASQKWTLILGTFFILGLVFRIYSLIAFVVMLGAIIAIARWWQTHSLDEVTYRRHFTYDRGFPGESLEMQVIVENKKFLPLPWLRVTDPLPRLIGPEDEKLLHPGLTTEQGVLNNVFSLRWYERDRRYYELLLRKRGVFRLGPAGLESGDLFGLFEQIGEKADLDYLTVFPKPVSIKALGLPVADPFGEQRAMRRLFEDPGQPMGVREYHPEDDFRRMHWPATARTGQLQVKVYQPVSARVLILCLNISTLDNVWEGTIPDLLEHLVSVTAALAQHALIDGFQVGLVSNGALAHADQPFRILPGRSPAQLVNLLTALAGVTPFVTGSFDRFLMAEAPRLPLGATLLMVTAVYPPDWDETLIKLKQHGRKITILSFASKPPRMIPGIEMIHRPYY
jgi:uncharacterized protein (DUF58 family)